MKQNSFMINILLEDGKDEETIMLHIYQAIQDKLNDYSIDYMNLFIIDNNKVYKKNDFIH